MPAIVVKALEVPVIEEVVPTPRAQYTAASSSDGAADLLGLLDDVSVGGRPSDAPASHAAPKADTSNLLDLLGGDLLGGGSSSGSSTYAPSSSYAHQPSASMGGGLDDLLGGLLGSSSAPAPVHHHAPAAVSHDPLADLMGGLGLGLGAPAPLHSAGGIPSITAYDSDGLRLVFAFEKPAGNPQLLNVNVTSFNTLSVPLSDYVFQAAVPTTLQLKLNGQSSNTISPNGSVSQLVQILNPTQQPIRLRIRLAYNQNGAQVVKTAEVNNFPDAAK